MPEPLLPRGVLTPLVTPFHADTVDVDRLQALIERQIIAGIDGIIVCDQMGEGLSLTARERLVVMEHAVDTANGRIPVVAAVGTNCTSKTSDMVAAVPDGVTALLVTVPYYSKPTAKGIVRHFQQVAETTTLPIIIDDDPARTAKPLTWEILEELRHMETVRGIRHCGTDVTGFVTMPSQLKRRFKHYAGNDRTALTYLMAGASCMSSPIANLLPDLVRSFFDLARTHTMAGENAAYERLCGALKFLGDGEPSSLKHALSALVGGNADVRLPLVDIDDHMAAGIEIFVERYRSCTRLRPESAAMPLVKFL